MPTIKRTSPFAVKAGIAKGRGGPVSNDSRCNCWCNCGEICPQRTYGARPFDKVQPMKGASRLNVLKGVKR